MAYASPYHDARALQETVDQSLRWDSVPMKAQCNPHHDNKFGGSALWNQSTNEIQYQSTIPYFPVDQIPYLSIAYPPLGTPDEADGFMGLRTPLKPTLSATIISPPPSPWCLSPQSASASLSADKTNNNPTFNPNLFPRMQSNIGPIRSNPVQDRNVQRRGPSPIILRMPSYPPLRIAAIELPALGTIPYNHRQGSFREAGSPGAPQVLRQPQGLTGNVTCSPHVGNTSQFRVVYSPPDGPPPNYFATHLPPNNALYGWQMSNDGPVPDINDFAELKPISEPEPDIAQRFCRVGQCAMFFVGIKECMRHRKTVHFEVQASKCPNPKCAGPYKSYSRGDSVGRHMKSSRFLATCGQFQVPKTTSQASADEMELVPYDPTLHIPKSNRRGRNAN